MAVEVKILDRLGRAIQFTKDVVDVRNLDSTSASRCRDVVPSLLDERNIDDDGSGSSGGEVDPACHWAAQIPSRSRERV